MKPCCIAKLMGCHQADPALSSVTLVHRWTPPPFPTFARHKESNTRPYFPPPRRQCHCGATGPKAKQAGIHDNRRNLPTPRIGVWRLKVLGVGIREGVSHPPSPQGMWGGGGDPTLGVGGACGAFDIFSKCIRLFPARPPHRHLPWHSPSAPKAGGVWSKV
jgi:hypothetical protein